MCRSISNCRSREVVTGCQETEYSYDAYFRGHPNEAFTFVALQTLAGLSRSATYEDRCLAIRKELPSRQYPQTPSLYGTKRMKQWKVFICCVSRPHAAMT
jgi:metacaspase-1